MQGLAFSFSLLMNHGVIPVARGVGRFHYDLPSGA